jgi:hypothetical protein
VPNLRQAVAAEAGDGTEAEAHDGRVTACHAAPDAVTADDSVAGRRAVMLRSPMGIQEVGDQSDTENDSRDPGLCQGEGRRATLAETGRCCLPLCALGARR